MKKALLSKKQKPTTTISCATFPIQHEKSTISGAPSCFSNQ